MRAFLFLGIISSLFQLVLLREFTFSIGKNELSFIIAAGFWLLFCSLGSISGLYLRLVKGKNLSWILSLFFIFSLCGAHLAKIFFGLSYYETADIRFVLTSAFLIMGAVSFFVGYCFSLLSQEYLVLNPSQEKTFGRFFAYEAMGFLIGGACFTFFLAPYTNPMIFSFLPVLFLFSPAVAKKNRAGVLLMILALGISGVLIFPYILKKELQGAEIIFYRGSEYGPILSTRASGVDSIYVNGSLAATSEDKLFNEQFIHTSFSAMPEAQTTLFIGPAFPGQLKEALAHKIKRMDLVHINPAVFKGRAADLYRYDPRVKFITDDPRFFLSHTGEKYDLIIMNLPPPSSLTLNRFYTLEFFSLIKKHLSERGLFSFSLPSKRDILSPNIARFDSCIVNTVSAVFPEMLLVPGDTMMLMVSSGRKLKREDIISSFSHKDLRIDFFTVHHLKDLFDQERADYVRNSLYPDTGQNLDLYPRGFLFYLFLDQARFYPGFCPDIDLCRKVIFFLFPFFLLLAAGFSLRLRKGSLLMTAFVVGFCSIGMSALLWVLFQIYSGALYWKMGIILGLFMAGLSSGTFFMNALLSAYPYSRKMLFWFFSAWCLFVLSLRAFTGLFSWESFPVFIFYFYSFLAGTLTGCMYPLISWCMILSGSEAKTIAPALYSSDLAGAFLGNICFSLLFIPFIGIYQSMVLLVIIALVLSLVYAREGLKSIRSLHFKS